jgi:hypothetical protein
MYSLKLQLRKIGSNSAGFLIPSFYVKERELKVGNKYLIYITEDENGSI